MIQITKSFQTSDGAMWASVEDAKRHELETLFPSQSEGGYHASAIAHTIWEHSNKIIDILTTTEKSKPKARKINGATKTRKVKTEVAL